MFTIHGTKLYKYSGKENTVNIPENVTEIDELAFYNCTNLETVIIPEGIVTISEYAFINCFDLKKVTLPTTIRKMGKQAFSNCWKLQEVNVPKEIEVDKSSFYFCPNVQFKRF